MSKTLADMLAENETLYVNCSHTLCWHSVKLDVQSLADRLDANHGALRADLVVLFRCTKCETEPAQEQSGLTADRSRFSSRIVSCRFRRGIGVVPQAPEVSAALNGGFLARRSPSIRLLTLLSIFLFRQPGKDRRQDAIKPGRRYPKPAEGFEGAGGLAWPKDTPKMAMPAVTETHR